MEAPGDTDRIASASVTTEPLDGLLPPGTLLGKYRILELIGRGGMGVVYRAQHVDLGTVSALKTLAPEWADHPLARARFLREAKSAAGIAHPHVVRIFDYGTHGTLPYFVMEHLIGEDLAAALARTTLTAEQTAGIMLAACAAISEMHDVGLIHRDLKPGNLFLARDRIGNIVPTVLDFGIAKPVSAETSGTAAHTQAGTLVGSPHYLSPEQLADVPAGEHSDQYSMGVVLYQCVTGRLPFDGESTLAVLRGIAVYQFVLPSKIRPDLPPGFEEVILRAMSERPADRFPSVRQLGRALLPFASLRHQSLWNDFYREERSSKAILTLPVSVAASSAWLPLPGQKQPKVLEPTRPLPQDSTAFAHPAKAEPRALADTRVFAEGAPSRVGQVGGTQPLPSPAGDSHPEGHDRDARGLAPGKPTFLGLTRGLFLTGLAATLAVVTIAAALIVEWIAPSSAVQTAAPTREPGTFSARSETNDTLNARPISPALPTIDLGAAREATVPPPAPIAKDAPSPMRRRQPIRPRRPARSRPFDGEKPLVPAGYPAVESASDSQYPVMK